MDPLYVDKPYFALPDGPVAEEAFAVVREAMVRADKVGWGGWCCRGVSGWWR